jgi:signal transduction histidine kinase
MTPRRAIFRRYARILSLSLAASLVAAGVLEALFAARENVGRAVSRHESDTRTISRQVESFLGEIERNLRAIASTPWGAGLGVAERSVEYQRVMRLLPAVRDITLADEAGREVLFLSRTDPKRVGRGRPVDLVDLAKTGAGVAAFGPVRHESTGAPFVRMAIRDRAGGTTIASVSLQFVSDELAAIPRRGREAAFVLDGEGRLVAHSDVSRPLGGEARHSLRDREIRVAREGSSWGSNAEGTWGLSIRKALRNPPWTVVVELPWSEALQPVTASLLRTLAMVGLAVAIAIAASHWLAERMAKPVLALKEGTAAFGAGNLDHRIALHTGDELEDLASAFNDMAGQLRDYTTGLERKVEEKTAALQEADRKKSMLLDRVQEERSAAEHALGLAQEAMRARALFLAAASHDLRQPLYAISILADTLVAEHLSADGQAVLERQRRAIAMLRASFDSLLDLSRLDTGEIRPVLRVGSLREIVEPVGMEFEVLARDKGLGWRWEVPDVAVRTDPELLRRLLGNLLSNAVRYTPSGEVSLVASASRGDVTVVVADTGVGIAAQDQARIFDDFVQLPDSTHHRDRGVGLGLSIVKRIATLLDSDLRLESEVGMGTRVAFRVPLAADG